MSFNCHIQGDRKYAGAFFPRARDLVIVGGTFISVTNIIRAPIPSAPDDRQHIDNDEFTAANPTPQSAKYAGAFFPYAQGLVLAGGMFVSVTNIVDNTSASGGEPPCMPPNLHINDEFTSDPRPQVAKHAGAFFPSAQGLIIGAGTFISITNIIQDLTTVFTRASAEFRPGLLGDQRLYGAVGCLWCERKIEESNETPQAGEIEVKGKSRITHSTSRLWLTSSNPHLNVDFPSDPPDTSTGNTPEAMERVPNARQPNLRGTLSDFLSQGSTAIFEPLSSIPSIARHGAKEVKAAEVLWGEFTRINLRAADEGPWWIGGGRHQRFGAERSVWWVTKLPAVGNFATVAPLAQACQE